MKALLIALTLAATPLHAGGPIITEEPPIADVRPQGDGGKWVVPVIVGVVILGAIISSDNCNSGEPTDGCR